MHEMTTFLNDLFWSRVIKAEGDGCWEYTRPTGERGYARLYVFGYYTIAHRLAWLITNGPIAAGLFVCHKCDNPRCVRPDHLFLGTAEENVQDMVKKGRAAWCHNSKKTHCKRGHELSGDNVSVNGRGSRVCRICQAERNARIGVQRGYRRENREREPMPA